MHLLKLSLSGHFKCWSSQTYVWMCTLLGVYTACAGETNHNIYAWNSILCLSMINSPAPILPLCCFTSRMIQETSSRLKVKSSALVLGPSLTTSSLLNYTWTVINKLLSTSARATCHSFPYFQQHLVAYNSQQPAHPLITRVTNCLALSRCCWLECKMFTLCENISFDRSLTKARHSSFHFSPCANIDLFFFSPFNFWHSIFHLCRDSGQEICTIWNKTLGCYIPTDVNKMKMSL